MTDPLETLAVIREAEVARLLDWIPLIDAVETALIAFSDGKVAQPVRQIIRVPEQDAIFAAMPAVGDAMAVKLVSLFHSNAGTDLPTHQGVIVLFDKTNGAPLALMDGRLITEMRTAAGSAAMVRKLAGSSPQVVTIMGSGVQARAHAAALATVCDVGELRVWARDAERGAAFSGRVGARFVADPAEAVRDADIVACTTAATEPILRGDWLKPGALVTAVGWNGADGRELDDTAMTGTVIVESRDAALDQSGNVRASGASIFAEAGEILSGRKNVPDGASVIYDSIGMAIMDVAAAHLVYDRWTDRQ